MSTQPAGGLTYSDLQAFPDDGLRREIIEGELFVTPSPSMPHQGAVREISGALWLYSKEHGGEVFPAPADVFLSDRDVVEPDVLFVRAEHAGKVEREFVRSAPDVVVEVSSPSTRRLELVRKRELYERFGVAEYWLVDLAEGRIESYRLAAGRYGRPVVFGRGHLLVSPLLPDFELPVDEVLVRPK